MTAIVIPVKPLLIAKQRLADVLTPAQRADLMLSMLHDVLAVATSLKEHDVWVVTSETTVVKLAKQSGAGVIPESVIGGYNAAVTTGLAYLDQQLSTELNVAIVPADIPLLEQEGLSRLTARCLPDSRTVRLAPAHDNEGTNGLFLSRTDLLQPTFGTNSFNRYKRDCDTIGIVPEILSNTSLAVDIDTPTDLQNLLAHSAVGATGAYVHHLAESAAYPAKPNYPAKNNTISSADSCH